MRRIALIAAISIMTFAGTRSGYCRELGLYMYTIQHQGKETVLLDAHQDREPVKLSMQKHNSEYVLLKQTNLDGSPGEDNRNFPIFSAMCLDVQGVIYGQPYCTSQKTDSSRSLAYPERNSDEGSQSTEQDRTASKSSGL